MNKFLPVLLAAFLLTSCSGWFFQPSPYNPPTPFLPPTHTPLIVTATSEDFAFMLQERPGAYICIGAGETANDPPLHNPYYDFNDAILPLGAAYWVELVKQQLPAA